MGPKRRSRASKSQLETPSVVPSEPPVEPPVPRDSQSFEVELQERATELRNAYRTPDTSIVVAPSVALSTPSAPSTRASEADDDTEFDGGFEDNFDGIDWGRLTPYMKPLRTQRSKKSLIIIRVSSNSKGPPNADFLCLSILPHP
ncbi:hypothetical protein GQ44DRAFT_734575 [Phaeosphaeriaceae sp. PMI808]|nr:hypothetical protein GQ44DRAFT_734575 [Phaeosphaeriaceae sp. PMI808]